MLHLLRGYHIAHTVFRFSSPSCISSVSTPVHHYSGFSNLFLPPKKNEKNFVELAELFFSLTESSAALYPTIQHCQALSDFLKCKGPSFGLDFCPCLIPYLAYVLFYSHNKGTDSRVSVLRLQYQFIQKQYIQQYIEVLSYVGLY